MGVQEDAARVAAEIAAVDAQVSSLQETIGELGKKRESLTADLADYQAFLVFKGVKVAVQ